MHGLAHVSRCKLLTTMMWSLLFDLLLADGLQQRAPNAADDLHLMAPCMGVQHCRLFPTAALLPHVLPRVGYSLVREIVCAEETLQASCMQSVMCVAC